jgi:hypothetical protein
MMMAMTVGIMQTRCTTGLGWRKNECLLRLITVQVTWFLDGGRGGGEEADALNVIMAVHYVFDAPVLLYISWNKLQSSSGGQIFVESFQSHQNAKR